MKIAQVQTDGLFGHDWAQGCEHCKYGIVNPTPNTSPLPLYLWEIFMAQWRVIQFCECRAGQQRQEHARLTWKSYNRGQEHIWQETINDLEKGLVDNAPIPTVTEVTA